MIRTREPFQGDLIDPITGARLVVRIPSWFGASAPLTPFQVTPAAFPVPADDPPDTARGVWTDAGYLPPGSF